MGAYAYCGRCDAPMSAPTFDQIVRDDWGCPACHRHHDILPDVAKDALVDLHDRIVRLEQMLGLAVE